MNRHRTTTNHIFEAPRGWALAVAVAVASAGCGPAGRALSPDEEKTAGDPLATTPIPYPSLALCAMQRLEIGSRADVFSYNRFTGESSHRAHVGSNRDLYLDSGAHVQGSAVAGAQLTLSDRATVDRHAVVGSGASLGRHAQVVEGISEAARAPAPCDCGVDLETAFSEVKADNDNDLLRADPTLAPYFVDGGLRIPARVKVVVPDGTYYLRHLSVGRGGQLEAKRRDVVTLYVTGEVSVERGADIEAHDTVQQIWIISSRTAAEGPLKLAGNSHTAARIFAPKTRVEVGAGASVLGSVAAGTISVGRGVNLRYDGVEVDGAPLSCQSNTTK